MELNKMTRPKITIHNSETDEIIEREMNEIEFAQFQKDEAEIKAHKVQAEAKAAEKAALLERLGITEDEAKLLLA
jgi:hypothetical protein